MEKFTIELYAINDILDVFPEGTLNEDAFYDHLNVSFGDATLTVVKGSKVALALYDSYEGKEDDRGPIFAQLPILTDALVALDG
jgi:hypothetical protein